MKTFQALIFLALFSSNVFSSDKFCNFQSSKFLNELQTASSIQGLEIQILNHRKYVMNSIKIMTARNDRKHIPKKYIDRYAGQLTVKYSFGFCNFPASIRINGDQSEHLSLVNGKPFNSLDIKLKKGNILSKVRFKLLLPETRAGIHEVFGTMLFQELGFLAPLTFLVDSKVNGVSGRLLFQENAEKELLESHSRKEGPIFEGDEALLWPPAYNAGSAAFTHGIRLTNKDWSLSNQGAINMSLNAFQDLQHYYFNSNLKNEFYYFINPNIHLNNGSEGLFDEYHILLTLFGGLHAVIGHNRKYYWNSSGNFFEPIYYDGNLSLSNFNGNRNPERLASYEFPAFMSSIKGFNFDQLLKKIENTIDQDFINQFAIQSKLTEEKSLDFTNNILKILKANVGELINNKSFEADKKSNFNVNWTEGMTRQIIDKKMRFGINQDYIQLSRASYHNSSYSYLCPEQDCAIQSISNEDVATLLSRNKLQNKRKVVLPASTLIAKPKFIETKLLNINILHSKNSIARIGSKGELVLEQFDSEDKFIIKDASLGKIKIIFIGKQLEENSIAMEKMFDETGFTGCLNIYNSYLQSVSFEGSYGNCEDMINIISSKGVIEDMSLANASFDAIDMDFSSVEISSLRINTAGNDCIDLSYGSYKINQSELANCADKGISIGERSTTDLNFVNVVNSAIGISFKDSALSIVKNFTGINLGLCFEAFKKKQEFTGSHSTIKYSNCNHSSSVDEDSILIIEAAK